MKDLKKQLSFMKEKAKELEAKHGWVTIPVFLYRDEDSSNKYHKYPLISWKGAEELSFESRWNEKILLSIIEKKEKIYKDYDPNIGIGVITGKPSNLTVIDIDDPTLYFELKSKIDTIRQETRRGGHLFFKYCPEVKTQANKKEKIDVRNDGGFIVVAPTRGYTMSGSKLADCPEWLLAKLTTTQSETRHQPVKDLRVSIHNLEQLVDVVNTLYHKGELTGYDVDLFISGLAYYGIDGKEIHRIAQRIFQEEYDEKRTEYMIDRGLDFKKANKKPIFFSIFNGKEIDRKTKKKLVESVSCEIVDELGEKIKEKFGITINSISLKGEDIYELIMETQKTLKDNKIFDTNEKPLKFKMVAYGTLDENKYYKVKILKKDIKIQKGNEKVDKKVIHYIVGVDEDLNTVMFKVIFDRGNVIIKKDDEGEIFDDFMPVIVTDNYFVYEKFGGIFTVDPSEAQVFSDYLLNTNIKEIQRIVDSQKNLEYIISISDEYIYDSFENFRKSFKSPKKVYARIIKEEVLKYIERISQFNGPVLPKCILKAISEIEKVLEDKEKTNMLIAWLKHYPMLLKRYAKVFHLIIGKKKINIDKEQLIKEPLMIDRMYPCSIFKSHCPFKDWSECEHAVPGDIYNIRVKVLDVLKKIAILEVNVVGEGKVSGEVNVGDKLSKMLRSIGAIVDEDVLRVNRRSIQKQLHEALRNPKLKINEISEDELYSIFIYALLNLTKNGYIKVNKKERMWYVPLSDLMEQMEYRALLYEGTKKLSLNAVLDFVKDLGKIYNKVFVDGRRSRKKGYLEISFDEIIRIINYHMSDEDENKRTVLINTFEEYHNTKTYNTSKEQIKENIEKKVKNGLGMVPPDPKEEKELKEKSGMSNEKLEEIINQLSKAREFNVKQTDIYKKMLGKYGFRVTNLIFAVALSDDSVIQLKIPKELKEEFKELLHRGRIDWDDVVEVKKELMGKYEIEGVKYKFYDFMEVDEEQLTDMAEKDLLEVLGITMDELLVLLNKIEF